MLVVVKPVFSFLVSSSREVEEKTSDAIFHM